MDFDAVYAALAPKLTNYLMGSGSAYAEACDIVQETFVKVWKRRDQLDDDASRLSGFVFTVARNLRRDHLRKASREVLEDEIRDAGSYEMDVESRDENAALRRRLNAALSQLPPLIREAFTLFQLGELSVREIAEQTGVSENNVKVRIFRAKERLREILKV